MALGDAVTAHMATVVIAGKWTTNMLPSRELADTGASLVKSCIIKSTTVSWLSSLGTFFASREIFHIAKISHRGHFGLRVSHYQDRFVCQWRKVAWQNSPKVNKAEFFSTCLLCHICQSKSTWRVVFIIAAELAFLNVGVIGTFSALKQAAAQTW